MRIEGSEPDPLRRNEKASRDKQAGQADSAGDVSEPITLPGPSAEGVDPGLAALVRKELEKMLEERPDRPHPGPRGSHQPVDVERLARAMIRRFREDWEEEREYQRWRVEQGLEPEDDLGGGL